MAIRLFVLLAPAVSAFVLSFAVARYYPAWKLGINPWAWWIGVFCAANLYLIWVDRLLSRLLPVATLFRISLVFPDEAPSRFKAALRATNSRSALKRLQQARESDTIDDEVTNSEKLLSLVTALSDHDRMTRGHAERVQAYCDLIAEELELPDADRGKLRWGALLHDMGKLEVPSEILNKDGRPSEEEWAILQAHPGAGRSYVEPLRPWLGDWLGAVDEHHCRWDGNGYPYDLAGTDITLSGRIAAVADAYDVMTSVRSYKKAMAPEVARQELVTGAGSQFDPEIVRAFLRVGLGQLRLVAGPLAWLASATGAVPAPIVGPALATVGAAAAVVGGSAFGLAPEPVETLAYVEGEPVSAVGAPLTVFEDETGMVEITIAASSPQVDVMVERPPANGSLGLASSFVAEDGSMAWTSNYAPVSNYHGDDEIVASACDVSGRCEPVRIPITVIPVQDPPVTGDDYADMKVGSESVVEPLVNDTDVDGDRLAIVSVAAPDGGVAKVDGDRVVFQAPDEIGTYQVTYVVDDGAGGTSEGVIVFEVSDTPGEPTPEPSTSPPSTTPPSTSPPPTTTPSNTPGSNTPPSTTPPSTTVPADPVQPSTSTPTTTAPQPLNTAPVAADDAATVPEDQVLRLDPLANDSDADGDVLRIAEVGEPSSGSVDVDAATGAVTYTPNPDFWGSDEFTYTVVDPDGAQSTATVLVRVEPVNDPPVARALVAEVVENGTGSEGVATVSASDVDGDPLVYSVVSEDIGGLLVIDGAVVASTGLFAIDASSGELSAASIFDHEAVSSHAVTVSVHDGTTSTAVPVTVNVVDVDEAPVVSSTVVDVPEDATVGTLVASSTAVDPEGGALTYTIASGDPSGRFDIDASGQVTVAAALNFETGSTFPVAIAVSDGVHTVTELLSVTVSDVNEPPVPLPAAGTVAEDSPAGTPVAALTATDPESDTLTFSIVGGDPGGWFTIDSLGAVSTSGVLDHESNPTVPLVVEVNDGVNSVLETMTVTVADVDEPPVTPMLSDSVSEDVVIGTDVLDLASFDPEGTALTFAITSGDPAKRLTVDGSGVISTAAKLDYESHGGFVLTVEIDDGTFIVVETVTVNVLDVNEPPVTAPASGSLSESAPVGSTVASLTASDPEGVALSYDIVDGDPSDQFTIDDSGAVTTSANLDFEAVSGYSLTVEISDGTFTVTETVTVTVLDENEPPVVSPTSGSVPEDVVPGTSVTLLAASDPEAAAVTYTIVGGDPDSRFAIDGSGLVTTADALDFEATDTYSLVVDVSDGVNVVPVAVDVTVTDVNEAPVAALTSLSVSEAATVGTDIGIANITDPEGDALTFAITAGDPAAQFDIDKNGLVSVAGALDTETTASYTLTVSASDGEFTTTATVTITVTDVNEPPATSPLSVTVAEDLAVGATMGTLSVVDPEGDRLTLTIVGGDPDGTFNVHKFGAVRTAAELDFETTTDYSLTIEVSDGVNTVTETVTVTVTDVNEPPETTPVSATLAENDPAGAIVGTVVADDPEGAKVEFAITAGNAAGLFSIDASGEVTTVGALDHETAGSHSLTIEVTDGLHTVTETATVIVSDVNEPPVVTPASATVDETAANGDVVVLVSASDPESGTLNYSISAGDTSGSFTIDGTGTITVADVLDHETVATYNLTVTVADGVHSVDTSVAITVADVNEGPTSASSMLDVLEGGTVSSGDLLGLHSDPEGDAFSITRILTDGSFGSASIVGGSSVTYVHGGGESLADSFTYELQDSLGNTGVGTVNVNITPVNDPPAVDATADQAAFVGVAYSQRVATSDPDNSVNSVAVTGLPAGLTYSFNASSGNVNISGTPTLATLDTTFPVTIVATDNLGVESAPMTFNIIVDPIGRSPYAGLIAITEVLYAESEPFNVADPLEPTLMDEYLEITNLASYQIDIENFSVTDTEDPSVATDFQFNTPPYLPQHTGRVNQAFTQPTPLTAGQVVTGPIRYPGDNSYQMQDGSTYPAQTWSSWFLGTAYGFPAGESSNWEAFENTGDDLWFWDPDGLLVAFVAWDNGTGDAHIASRPPVGLGLWDSTHEGRLANAGTGRSISLAVNGDNTTSACWERTASGDAAASGCGSVVATRDLDPIGTAPPTILQGRVSSQGQIN